MFFVGYGLLYLAGLIDIPVSSNLLNASFRTRDGKAGERYPMVDFSVLNVLKLLIFW